FQYRNFPNRSGVEDLIRRKEIWHMSPALNLQMRTLHFCWCGREGLQIRETAAFSIAGVRTESPVSVVRYHHRSFDRSQRKLSSAGREQGQYRHPLRLR